MRIIVAMFIIWVGLIQAETQELSTSKKAQLFASADIVEYVGYFDFERIENGVRTGMVWGRFHLNGDQRLTFLEVNGVELFRDYENPRPAVLPANRVGEMRNFYAYISARKGWEEELAWDSIYKEYLESDGRLSFTLRLSDQFQTLDFPAGNISGEDLVITVNGQRVGYYDEEIGAFRLWLDPNLGEVEYRVSNQWTEEDLQIGTLSPIAEPTVVEGNVLNLNFDDGIEVVDLVNNDQQYFYRGFPGQDKVGRVLVPVKVFILERSDDTYLYVEGAHGGFEVKVQQDQGEMPIWPVVAWGHGSYTIPAGPEKLIVVFYGNEDVDGKFHVSFSTGEGGKG